MTMTMLLLSFHTHMVDSNTPTATTAAEQWLHLPLLKHDDSNSDSDDGSSNGSTSPSSSGSGTATVAVMTAAAPPVATVSEH